MTEEQVQDATMEQEPQVQSDNMLTPKPEDFLKDASFDKFRGEDGNVDAVKMAKSYRALEQKLGRGAEDMPPETEDGYEVPAEMPAGMTAEQLGVKELLSKLHKAGAGKKVVSVVMNEYMNLINKGSQAQAEMAGKKAQEAEESLKSEWGVDFNRQVQRAQKAFQAVADERDMEAIGELSSSPAVMRLLAKLGRNLEEDSPVQSGSSMPQEDLSALMKSEAYWDRKHPEHERVKSLVTQHFSNKQKRR